MSLLELKAFNAVALGGGFVRGAEMLRRSQPTVTAQVRALESRHGVELFYRSRGQTAQLTPLGRQLFESTRTLFKLEDDAQAILGGAGEHAKASLRVGVIAPRSAMGLVSRFTQRHPQAQIEMRVANSTQVLEWLRTYEVDVGILGAHEHDPVLYMRRFSTPEIVLLAAAGRRLGRGGLITREAFAKQTLILREKGSETRSLMETALARHGWKPARVFEIASREGVTAAAEAGLGVAPISLAELDPRPAVQILRLADLPVFGEMFIACMNNRRHMPVIRRLLEVQRPARPLGRGGG